jgi:hypothetical protein
MYDHINTAHSVSRWTDLGINLPKELGSAVEVFEALRWVETGRAVEFDLAGVTAANAEAKVTEFANRLVPAMKTGDHLARTPLEEAKSRMLKAAARDVLNQAAAAVPVVITELTPAFNEHVEAYVAAVDSLPESIDSESLVDAGAVAVSAYATAQIEAAWLGNVSSWVAGTSGLPGFAGSDADPALRILRPADATQLAKLDSAQRTTVDRTLYSLNPVFYTAAREGIEFGINTLTKCAELRRSIR